MNSFSWGLFISAFLGYLVEINTLTKKGYVESANMIHSVVYIFLFSWITLVALQILFWAIKRCYKDVKNYFLRFKKKHRNLPLECGNQ